MTPKAAAKGRIPQKKNSGRKLITKKTASEHLDDAKDKLTEMETVNRNLLFCIQKIRMENVVIERDISDIRCKIDEYKRKVRDVRERLANFQRCAATPPDDEEEVSPEVS